MIKQIINSIITFALTIIMGSSTIASENIENNNINTIDNNEEIVVKYNYGNLKYKEDKHNEEDNILTTNNTDICVSEPLNDTYCETETLQVIDSVDVDCTTDYIDIDDEEEYIDNDYEDCEEENYEDENKDEEALLDYALEHLDEYEYWWEEHEDEGYAILYIVIEDEIYNMRFCIIDTPIIIDNSDLIDTDKEIDMYIENELDEENIIDVENTTIEEDVVNEDNNTSEEIDIENIQY